MSGMMADGEKAPIIGARASAQTHTAPSPETRPAPKKVGKLNF